MLYRPNYTCCWNRGKSSSKYINRLYYSNITNPNNCAYKMVQTKFQRGKILDTESGISDIEIKYCIDEKIKIARNNEKQCNPIVN